jgi:uncharacterized protein
METDFIAAVRQHDLELVKKLILEGANINEQDEQGWTALHWAAGSGDIAMIRLLLEHHGDMSAKGRDNRTACMVARAAGRSEVVEFLMQAEKAAGVWKDPRENRPYCKGFYLKDLCGFSQWPRETVPADEAIVYLHQDLTVTRSVWPGEDVIFSNVTPEWVQYCRSRLNFSVPPDLI